MEPTSNGPDPSPFFERDDNFYEKMDSSLSIAAIVVPATMFSIMVLYLVFLGCKWHSRAPMTLEQKESEAKSNAEMIEKNLITRKWQAIPKGKGTSMNTEKRETNTAPSGKPDGEYNDGNANNFDKDKITATKSERAPNKGMIRKDTNNNESSLNETSNDLDDVSSCFHIDILMGDGEDSSSSSTHFGCAICLKSFRANDMVSESKNSSVCQHRFHKECILMWLERQNCCPLCKEPYVAQTVYETQTA